MNEGDITTVITHSHQMTELHSSTNNSFHFIVELIHFTSFYLMEWKEAMKTKRKEFNEWKERKYSESYNPLQLIEMNLLPSFRNQ